MKIKLVVGVYKGDDLFDTASYVVQVEPLARILARMPENLDEVSVDIEGIEVLSE